MNERVCPQCGFDASATDPTDVAALIRANAADWRVILGGDPATVGARPRPDLWSPLEYGCHVRDVYALYLERLERMLTEVEPHYANWDQDATAVERRYDLADATQVATELDAAARALADRFDDVAGEAWQRTGVRGDGAVFTVASFATYLVHDPIHHVWDATRNGR